MSTKLNKADRDAVGNIVNTSIDDAKNYIAHLPKSEHSLYILTAALEYETADLSPRSSLVKLIRAAMKRQAKTSTKPAKAEKKPRAAKAPKNPVFQVAGDLLAPHPALERVLLVAPVADSLHANARSHEDRLQRANEVSADWSAWVAELKANGIMEPLRVIKRKDGKAYWIADGRNRHAGGTEAGITSFPVIEVTEEDLPKLAVGTVTGRRHWTKSQRAFFAVLMNPEVAAEGRRGGDRKSNPSEKGLINGDLAARFGVSLALIELAIKLYRLLDQYPDFRNRIEPALWGGTSLQDCLNGLNALVMGTTGPGITHPKIPTGRFSTAWKHESAAAAKWAALTEENRIVLTNDLRSAAKDLPADYLDWKMDILADVLAEMRKADADADAAVPAALSED